MCRKLRWAVGACSLCRWFVNPPRWSLDIGFRLRILKYGSAIVSSTTIAGKPSFHLFGFLMCIGATAARALKSVVQGILLSFEGEKLNSMNMLLYMAPIVVVLLLPATLIMEDNVVDITLALAREDFELFVSENIEEFGLNGDITFRNLK